MGRRCTICDHPSREGINRAILNRRPYAEIMQVFSVTARMIQHHRKHLVVQEQDEPIIVMHPIPMPPPRAERSIQAISAVEEFVEILSESKRILRTSEDDRIKLAAVAQVRGILETMAGLAIIAARPEDAVNVTGSADPPWARVKEVLLDAGDRYPEARRGLEYALELLGHEA